MGGALQLLGTPVWQTFGLLALRALPTAAFVLLSRKVPATTKVVGMAGYCALIVLLVRSRPQQAQLLSFDFLGLLLLALLCAGVYPLAKARARGQVTRSAVMVLCGFGFLLAGALVLPPSVLGIFPALGMALMFSAYSYAVDARSTALGDCLFFLWVDPTLVYGDRARPGSGETKVLHHVARVGLGLGAIVVAFVLRDLAELALRSDPHGAHPLVQGARLGATWVLPLLFLYFTHSGLASIQIGLLRSLGFQIGERYHYPLMARDMADFWRRWNRYLGAWLKRYVFVPLARRLRKARPGLPREATQGIALLLTFAAAGLAHDAAGYRVGVEASLHFTAWFLIVALVVGVAQITWGPRQRRAGKSLPVRTFVTTLRMALMFALGAMFVS